MSGLRYATYASPFGPLTLGVTSRGLALLHIGAEISASSLRHFDSALPDGVAVAPFWRALEPYFHTGDLPEIPLDMQGTDFQLRCWSALRSIPKGETRSYLDLARIVAPNKKNLSRAVGGANGANPIAILVPCHRVIASDGTLGGYGGGLAMKRRLLQLEGARFRELRTANSAPRLFV